MVLRFAKNRVLSGLLMGLAVGVLASLLFYGQFELFARWQQAASDLLFLTGDPADEIVIVGVDDKSLEKLGRWPWSRDVHADMLTSLSRAEPKVIGLDMIFSEPGEPAGDAKLEQAIADAGNVVVAGMASGLGSGPRLLRARDLESPETMFEKASDGVGLANVTPSPDNTVRTLPPVIEHRGDWHESLSLQVVRLFRDLPEQEAPLVVGDRRVAVGGTRIPVDAAGRMLINYSGPPGHVQTVSYLDVLEGRAGPSTFRDKIVLVGITAIALGESIPTPVSGQPMYGVEVHANAIDTILKGRFLTEQSRPATTVILILLGLVSGVAMTRIKPLKASLLGLGLIAIYLVIAFGMREQGVIYNVVYAPMTVAGVFVGTVAYERLREEAEKNRVTGLFGRYVSPDIVTDIIRAGDEDVAKLEGVRDEVTILFADMCAFTSMSEKMEPEDVVQTLNQYLGLMSKIVFEHGGTVDKYMGDCVMAFFNAPRSQDDHAAQAVRAALAIHEQTAKLGDDKLPAIDMSIGINTGEAVIGNIGGEHRLDYTAIGDSINVGARLCSAAGTAETLITSSTHKFVKDSFKCRKLGPEKFKGKKEPVVVYAVEGGETPEQSPQAD